MKLKEMFQPNKKEQIEILHRFHGYQNKTEQNLQNFPYTTQTTQDDFSEFNFFNLSISTTCFKYTSKIWHSFIL